MSHTSVSSYLSETATPTEQTSLMGGPAKQTMEGEGLLGGGKGAGVSITKGLPLMDDDNFCRFRCLCMDSGCKKLELKFQWFCIKIDL